MTKALRGNDGEWRPMSIIQSLQQMKKENAEMRALLAQLIAQVKGLA
jgi:hypothetical protein